MHRGAKFFAGAVGDTDQRHAHFGADEAHHFGSGLHRDRVGLDEKRLAEMEAFDLAYSIVTEAGIIRDLKSDQAPENVSRYENIEELLNGIKVFTDDTDREGDMTLGDYLQEVTLMTNADMEKDEDHNKVTLMTIHSAKGL